MDVPHIKKESTSSLPESLQRMRELFPQFVKENTIDFDALKAFFDEKDVSAGQEKYGLSWAGKSDAFRAIRVPATGALVPQEEESKDWDNTENLFIEGDNLEVLKLLQKHYREKIKMIYIDPPYNTGKDFIYKDNFTQNVSDYYERTGQSKDGVKLTSNLETNGRYHSDWLTMMYPRLFLARNLLKEDGVIFISIDDNEVANLRLIMDEIFGEENFYISIIWKKRGGAPNDQVIGYTHEYIVCYSKNIEKISLFRRSRTAEQLSRYTNPDNHIKGEWASDNLMANIKGGRYVESLYFPIINPHTGEEHFPSSGGNWRFNKERIQRLLDNDEIYFGQDGRGRPKLKRFLSEVKEGTPYGTIWDDVGYGTTATREMQNIFDNNPNIFDTPKPAGLIKNILSVSTNNNDLVLDFFAGSGTLADAVMDLNAEDCGGRKWICVQLPEVSEENSEAKKAGFNTIAQISRERIRRAGVRIIERHDKMERFEMVKGEFAHSDILKNKNLDIGFKSFKLASSNYRQWNVLTDKDDPQKLKEQMKLFVEKPLMDGSDEKSVVYEILTKEGFDLNSKVEQKKVGGMEVWSIVDAEKKMIISFASKVDRESVESLGLSEHDIFVCLDAALSDTERVNFARVLTLKVI